MREVLEQIPLSLAPGQPLPSYTTQTLSETAFFLEHICSERVTDSSEGEIFGVGISLTLQISIG